MKNFPDLYEKCGIVDFSKADKSLEECKKKLEDKDNHKEWLGTVTSFNIIDVGGKIKTCYRAACHAPLYALNLPHKIAYVHQALSCFERETSTRPVTHYAEFEDYFYWLFNESPLKDVFLMKDVEEAYKSGQVIRTDIHNTVLAFACCMTRYAGENRDMLRGWNALVKAGMDKDVAFLLCHVIRGSQHGNLYYSHVNRGHVATENTVNKTYIMNFKKGDFQQGGHNDTYAVKKQYDGIARAVNGFEWKMLDNQKEITSIIKDFIGKSKKDNKSKVFNPFKKAVPKNRQPDKSSLDISVLPELAKAVHKELGL